MRGLFVTGTDTGAGKSILAAAVAAALRAAGHRVSAFKPVLTGTDEEAAAPWPRDDELLRSAAGTAIVPHRFGPPVSPHLAAELAGTRVELDALAGAARAVDADVLVVEGVGGLLVPLTADALVRDLAAELGLPLIVASRPGLGTINHTLLTLEAARSARLRVAAVVMTPWPAGPSAMERSNRETVARLGDVEVAVLPRLAGPRGLAAAGAALRPERWLEA